MSDKSQFSKIEEELIKVWEKENIFKESIDARKDGKRFRFYDGPPFTSGPPHYGHVEQSSLKDAMARYKTMQGFYVPRRTGSDTHGLPIENLVEKERGFKTKKDIVDYGIDKFNEASRAVVFRHKEDFTAMYKRIGRWDDPDNTYATLDNDYIESVWWAFSEMYKSGLIYKGYKSMPYCPRCGTPLSNFEMNDGYKDDVPDPSLYVKFKLANEDAFLLGWTTTPWSLPGNAAIAVSPGEKYVYVELMDDNDKKETLVLAQKRLEALGTDDYHVIKEVKGADLVGKTYEPLFKLDNLDSKSGQKNLYKVWPASVVSVKDGSGVLHVAPAFGEDDLNLGQKFDIPVLSTIDAAGKVTGGIGYDEIQGMFFKKADQHIVEHLTKNNRVYSIQTSTHTYPFCWRCETPLLYYAMDSWFVNVTKIKDDLVSEGAKVSWTPTHIKQGRWMKWLEGARDWAISRTRFWGAPIPVWQNVDDPEDRIVISSIEELKKLSGEKNFDLHRPDIDNVVIEKDGKKYRRIEEVFDCWFESGSMPYGQDHYPFENKDDFEESFPADFICEAYEMVHLWFYTLHVVGVALKKKRAYQNVVASGLILAADGKKLSKRLRNYPPIESLFDNYGADTTRFFILNSPLMNGQDTRLTEQTFKDIYRNVFMTLWNSHNFFKMYADIDNWKPSNPGQEPETDNVLDQWVISRLNKTIIEVTSSADKYQVNKATQPITELIDDLSNWYIRRSRRRFWKSEDDVDKNQAYETLWYVLVRLCQLLAPWAPFLSDYLWRELTAGTKLPISVHLSDWPEAEIQSDSNQVIEKMQSTRQIINDALSQRGEAKIKVRQPLGKITVEGLQDSVDKAYLDIIKDEVNVHEVVFGKETKLDIKITPALYREGLMREIVRHVQNARKKAGLNVDDRIELSLVSGDKEVLQAIKEHNTTIAAETLATKFNNEPTALKYTEAVTLEGSELTINLQKA